MVVLGVDSATADAVVGVTADGAVVSETQVGPGADGRPRHSRVLLPEIESSVDAAGGWVRIDRIAVGIGPGSFTGLRIGIATTRALAQASGTPIAPVGTLSALARGVSAQAGGDGALALPVIDARRGEVFAALVEGDGSEVWPPLVATPNQVAARVRKFPGDMLRPNTWLKTLRFSHPRSLPGFTQGSGFLSEMKISCLLIRIPTWRWSHRGGCC